VINLKPPQELQKGWNSYVAMNAFTPGLNRRRKKDVKNVRSVYVEFDENGEAGLDRIDADVAAGVIRDPHFILESSPEKFYVIWKVKNFSVAQQEALNSALQKRYGSDPPSVDAARVLRLPGARNLKPKYSPTPIVEIVEQRPAKRYRLDDFNVPIEVKPASVDHSADPDKVKLRANYYEHACDDAGVDPGYCKEWEGGYLYEVDCPNHEQHTGMVKSGASVKIHASGRISFSCFHGHCKDLNWKDYYRPWMEKQAKDNGHEGFLKFGDSNEIDEDERKDVVLFGGKAAGTAAPATPVAGSEQTVVDMVHDLLFLSPKDRAALGLPRNFFKEALDIVDKLIYDDLKAKGKFFNVGGLGYLILTGREAEPIQISRDGAECQDLLEKYNLHAGREATKLVGKFLGVRSYIDGDHVARHISFHYDSEANTAYYAEQLGWLLKVTKDGISKIKNGKGGILFTYPDTYKPWTLNPAPKIASEAKS
jgi:hypothetical protein